MVIIYERVKSVSTLFTAIDILRLKKIVFHKGNHFEKNFLEHIIYSFHTFEIS